MPRLLFTPQAALTMTALEFHPRQRDPVKLKKIREALGHLELGHTDGTLALECQSLGRPEKPVFDAFLPDRMAGNWRIFWSPGPEDALTILAIVPIA